MASQRLRESFGDKPGSDEAVPFPPPRLRMLVNGSPDPELFDRTGLREELMIRDLLARNGRPIETLGSVLDFGCGAGRLLRRWADLAPSTQLQGTEYSETLASWCRQNLPFAEIGSNGPAPPLSYDDETFDFVYALSVFTHTARDLQEPWLQELRRILKPRGLLLFTTMGESYARAQLDQQALDLFLAGDLVVEDQQAAPANLCAAYHPRSCVEQRLLDGFRLVDFEPGPGPEPDKSARDPAAGGGAKSPQDAFLVERV